MNTKTVLQAKTMAEAMQYAIDWQTWQSEISMSYGEAMGWAMVFSELADKFGLVEEFKENGII